MAKLIDDSEFLHAWNNSATLDEVSALTGLEPRSCTMRAARLRNSGHELLRFQRGPKVGAPHTIPTDVTAMLERVATLKQAVARAKADLLLAEAELSVYRSKRGEDPEIIRRREAADAAYRYHKEKQDRYRVEAESKRQAFADAWNAAADIQDLAGSWHENMREALKLRRDGYTLKTLAHEFDPEKRTKLGQNPWT